MRFFYSLLICIIISPSSLSAYAQGKQILFNGIGKVDSCLMEKSDSIKEIEIFEFLAFLHYAFNKNDVLDYGPQEASVIRGSYERFKADYWQNSAAYEEKVDSIISSMFIFHSVEKLSVQNKHIWNENGALFLLHKLDKTLEPSVFDFHKISSEYLHRLSQNKYFGKLEADKTIIIVQEEETVDFVRCIESLSGESYLEDVNRPTMNMNAIKRLEIWCMAHRDDSDIDSRFFDVYSELCLETMYSPIYEDIKKFQMYVQ